MYAIDAKYSILMRISAIGGAISSGGPSIVLEADVLEGPVRDNSDSRLLRLMTRPLCDGYTDAGYEWNTKG